MPPFMNTITQNTLSSKIEYRKNINGKIEMVETVTTEKVTIINVTDIDSQISRMQSQIDELNTQKGEINAVV